MRKIVLALVGLAMLVAAVPRDRLSPLATVLAAYDRALGTWTPTGPHTQVLHWAITESDLSGTATEVVSGSDDRTDEQLGDETDSYGSIGGHGWSENANGEVVDESGIHDRVAVDDRVFASVLGDPRLASTGVRLGGRVSQPFDSYAVVVDPANGVPETLYIDASTSRLDERVIEFPGHTITDTYDDYRTTLGLTFAWHVHESIDAGRVQVDRRLVDVQIGAPIDPALLAEPQGRSIVSFAQPVSTLPATIADDRIIVPVTLGSHTVNLQLDSGASGIVLDRGIVQALGYAEHGHITAVTAGTYVESDAVVPSMAIGDLSMANVHVESIPFASMVGGRPVAGLLGFDFLDCVVVHVDYADGTVQAMAPQSFVPPPGAVAIPIALDDGIPAIDATLGTVSPVRMLVDTGADRSLLFSSFGRAHPDAFVDQGLGDEMEAESPFLGNFEGVGGTVQVRPIQLGPLHVGAWSFPRWLFYVTQDPARFEIQDYDGIIGQDFLRYYDLYLDYPHGRILLAPNARYTQRFST